MKMRKEVVIVWLRMEEELGLLWFTEVWYGTEEKLTEEKPRLLGLWLGTKENLTEVWSGMEEKPGMLGL